MNEQKSLLLEVAEAVDRRLRQRVSQSEGAPPVKRRPGWLRWLARQMVPNIGTLLMVVILLLTVPSLAAPMLAPSATSTSTISYQGRLADSAGNPLTGMETMEFRIYDVPTGGVPLWEEYWTGANAVAVSDGLFNVMLGSIDNTLASSIEGHDELYLGITVGADSEMVPRVQLGSVPFSMMAQSLVGQVTTEQIADGAVTSAKLARANGHISLIPDPGRLVKIAMLRQDDSTNSYENDQVILTGWSYITGNDSEIVGKNTAFGVTFSEPPVVLISKIGRMQSGTPTSISDFTGGVEQEIASAEDITTTGFRVVFANIGPGNLGMGIKYGFSWIAIGTLE